MYKISACCCRILLTSNTVDGIYYFRLVVFFRSFFLFLYSSHILSFFAYVVKNELGKRGEPILSYIISFQVLYYFGWGGEDEMHSEVVCGASRDE